MAELRAACCVHLRVGHLRVGHLNAVLLFKKLKDIDSLNNIINIIVIIKIVAARGG